MSAQTIADATDLPTRLLATLEARKLSADGPYPLTIRELAQFAGTEVSPEQVYTALTKQPIKKHVVLGHAKKSLDAPLALIQDVSQLAQSDKLLEFALEQTCTAKKLTCNASDVKAKVAEPLQTEFLASIESRLMEGRLPSAVRCLDRTKELYLTRLPPLDKILLNVLESQRLLGAASHATSPSGLYPPTIRKLAELVGPGVSPEQVQKALGKGPIKARIVLSNPKSLDAPLALVEDATLLAESDPLLVFVLEQVCTEAERTCTAKNLKTKVAKPLQKEFLAAVERRLMENKLPEEVGQRTKGKTTELYLKRWPPPDEVLILAEKMLRVLESQRTLGSGSYPLTKLRLIELTDRQASQQSVAEALQHPLLHDKLFLVDLKKSGCLVAFQEDQKQVLRSDKLLELLIRAKRKPTEHTFAIETLAKGTPLMSLIVDALKTQIEANSLPPTIGWMWIGKNQRIFLMEDVHAGRQPAAQPTPAASRPTTQPVLTADIARAFDEAFMRLDRHHGSHNFVHLKDLRKVLPFARDVFDAQLRALRLAGRYTLSAAEGRHGLTAEEREAGIVEDGSLLLYVSRKSS